MNLQSAVSYLRGMVCLAVLFAFAGRIACAQATLPRYRAIVLKVPATDTEYEVPAIGNGQAAGYAGTHAVIWSADTHEPIDLHNPDCTFTKVHGADRQTQVGEAFVSVLNGGIHAVMWRGTANSMVDLNPEGSTYSIAWGCGGNQQVGSVIAPFEMAALWTGTARSAVKLHPQGYSVSRALATDGHHQVGQGAPQAESPGNAWHALMWSGTAQSVVDLQPVRIGTSCATGVSGKYQVGYGALESRNQHALLWTGTAASMVDLNPPGWDQSCAMGVSGLWQVGWALRERKRHAALWHGTAQSAFDLHTLLPPGYEQSQALAIDEMGNIVGKAVNSVTHRWDLILWQRQGDAITK